MAPVTGRITNGQKNRPVEPVRRLKRFFTPRVPVNRIKRVLEKVWTLFVDEPIGLAHRPLLSRIIHPTGYNYRASEVSQPNVEGSDLIGL